MLSLAGLMRLGMSRYGTLAFVVFLLAHGYVSIRPSPPPLAPAQAGVAERVASRAAETLGAHAPDAWAGKYVMVARLEGDYRDSIRTRVQTALKQRMNCKILQDTSLAEIRDQMLDKAARFGISTARTADRLKANQAQTSDEAGALGKRRGADIVVYGTVQDFRLVGGQAHAKLIVSAADITGATVVARQEIEEGTSGTAASVDGSTMRATSRRTLWLFVRWLLFAVLLPVCTAAFWMRLLERESMRVNLFCVLALTSLDALLAWATMGFWMETAWDWLILFLGIAMAGNYNLFILNILERNRESRKYAV